MKAYTLPAILCLTLTLFVLPPVSAQFEGEIKMRFHNDDDSEQPFYDMSFFATPTRVFIRTQEKVELSDGFNSDGILIRADKKDIVIMTSATEALSISKKDIESLASMANSFGVQVDSGPAPKVEYTNKTRTISGRECAELIITQDNESVTMWLAPGIDINWGLLVENLSGLPGEMGSSLNVYQQHVFGKDVFPMMIESTDKNGNRKVVAEVISVQEKVISSNLVELPSGVKVVPFQDFLFQMMMRQ